jgi:hypothetical protein
MDRLLRDRSSILQMCAAVSFDEIACESSFNVPSSPMRTTEWQQAISSEATKVIEQLEGAFVTEKLLEHSSPGPTKR